MEDKILKNAEKVVLGEMPGANRGEQMIAAGLLAIAEQIGNMVQAISEIAAIERANKS